MWNKNFNLLLIANFFLYTAVYMLFPALHHWMVSEGGYTGFQAGGAIAIFGASLFLLGAFNNYLVDTFKRKNVCTRSLLLLALLGLLYPYAGEWGMIFLLRVLQGALFGGGTDGHGQYPGHRCNSQPIQKQGQCGFPPGRGYSVCCAASCWDIMQAGIFLSSSRFIFLVGLCALPVVLVSMVEVCFRAPLDLPLLSFDRFLLFRTLIPGLNMMVVPFILGVLFSSIFDTFFYICIIAGFIVFLLLDRVVRKQVNGRLLNGVGLVLMCVAVWLLDCSTEKGMLIGAGFLTGLGMGFSLLQFLRMMIRLPLHCERGTGYHTYQLLWESGVMLGVFFGKYTEDISGQQFRAASLILLAGLLIYQAVVHGYFMKRMKNR